MYKYLFKYALDCLRYPKLSDDEVTSRQLKKFNNIFSFAGKYVPFYSELYKKHLILGAHFHYLDEIDKVPTVSKADFRRAKTDDLLSTVNMGKLNEHYTSGSTGEPFLVRTTKEAEYTAHLRIFLALVKHGYTPNRKMIILSRFESDAKFEVEKDIGVLKHIQRGIGLFNREIISIYENPDTIALNLVASKPHVLVSTPGILSILINYLRSANFRLRIPLIFLTSETISPLLLNELHDYLGEKVIDMYGCMECPSIGYAVDGSGGRDIFAESCFLELLDEPDEKEDCSKVVVTNLLNHAQPIIRYSVNDLAVKLSKRNKGIRKLGRIIGRIDDVITTSDGTIIAHHHAHEMFIDFKECRQFKFVQEQDQVRLLLVVDEGTDKQMIMAKAQERLHKRYPRTDVTVEFTNEILPDRKTGKIKNIEVIL